MVMLSLSKLGIDSLVKGEKEFDCYIDILSLIVNDEVHVPYE